MAADHHKGRRAISLAEHEQEIAWGPRLVQGDDCAHVLQEATQQQRFSRCPAIDHGDWHARYVERLINSLHRSEYAIEAADSVSAPQPAPHIEIMPIRGNITATTAGSG